MNINCQVKDLLLQSIEPERPNKKEGSEIEEILWMDRRWVGNGKRRGNVGAGVEGVLEEMTEIGGHYEVM